MMAKFAWAAAVVAVAVPAAAADNLPPGRAAQSGPEAGSERIQEMISKGELRFDLRRLVPLVCERNARVAFEALGFGMATERLNSEDALYDPEVFGSYNYSRTKTPNTATEYYNQSFREVHREEASTYRAGVGGLLPTGAHWTLGYRFYDRDNDLIRSRYRGESNREYQAVLEVTLRQPLLKDFGNDATTVKVQLAGIDRDIAFQKYRLRMMEVAGSAISAYWDMYQVQEVVGITEESVKTRKRVVALVADQVRFGKTSQAELPEAEAGVSSRMTSLFAARQDLVDITNRLRGLLNLRGTLAETRLTAIGATFTTQPRRADLQASLERALGNWPEYLIADRTLRQAAIQLKYAKNQSLPQLDLVGNYGHAGLDVVAGRTMDQTTGRDYPSWSVGLEFRRPITNEQADAKVRAATLRDRQAQVELEATELAIRNALDTKLQKVRQMRDELEEHKRTVQLRQSILKTELDRLNAGKSRVSDVIDKDEKLSEAKIAEMRSQVELEKAIAAVELAEGTLLDRFGVQLRLAEGE